MEIVTGGVPPRRERRERRAIPKTWAQPALRVVAIGGGTGLPTVLGGLARLAGRGSLLQRLEVTAVVAASDDGGSSGRLRRENGVLPPGDVRNCLVALADDRRRALARLFRYRFGRGEGLRGHSMGNLLLTALTSLEGDFLGAIERAERMLGCKGRVLPSTLEAVRLVGLLEDGSRLEGEHTFVGERAARVARIELLPRAPRPAPGVLEAIRAADLIVLGPGSLYSSVITNLLVDGVAEAVRESGALRILVQNLMTEPGETHGLDAVGHVEAVMRHAGKVADVLLVDARPRVPSELLQGYARKGQHPVRLDKRAILARGVIPVEADLLAGGARVRHDPDKLAAAVIGLALQGSEA
ncbi:MAG TPA: gluconeogenesis factor YvcK family protein [Vulgatibacter sp.]|nr:gluconeogenesis factor YvcK family protein [Vulgatibacter sp.]